MPLVDYFAYYFYALKYVVIFVAIVITISGIDDLIIDVAYWARWLWRMLTIYRHKARSDQSLLLSVPEKPLAIMIPAWHETGVIGQMADNAARTLDYENYHIFVGTYPNDPDTQRDVDEVCARFPNVHKVVCARPGPTSKADCLNNVLDAIRRFEAKVNLKFMGFILHDAEDVISPMELRLFNYLVGKKDLIQVPVYPFERRWYDFVGMHYIDEFTELHAKDVPLREAVVGQVPSAGVGTCFSRRAVDTLLLEGDGIAFDTQSLTEDYDIGFRLKEAGLEEVFVRFPVLETTKDTWRKTRTFGQNFRVSNIICVREFFPNTIETAVRQKSRWIIGIVFQGFVTHRWSRSWLMNYFLWRDRKGVITNFFSFAANFILFQITLLWLYELLWPDAYRFLSIFEQSELLFFLLWFNVLLLLNRILQRVLLVTGYYGIFQGLLALPRMLLGNFINFLANWRAIKQVIQKGNPRRVAWDKTTHDFPSLGEVSRARRVLGQILIEQGALTEQALKRALENKPEGMRLGTWLIHDEQLAPEQLASALAYQAEVSFESFDAYEVSDSLVALLPARIALHYAVFPIRLEGERLVVASESALSPVVLAALKRKLGREVTYVISFIGQVTVGLRHCYARSRQPDPRQELAQAVLSGALPADQQRQAWAYYVSRQIILGEVLQSVGRIDAAALSAMLLQQYESDLRLGDFLVVSGVITQETLQYATDLQANIQPSMSEVIASFTGSGAEPVRSRA
jgi:bacteriophage N4 adsorption protein B